MRFFKITVPNVVGYLKIQAESLPEPDKISNINKLPNLIEEVDIAKEINSEENSDDVLELLDSHNQEQAIEELIEMQEQDIEELDSVDPLQSEDRMIVLPNYTRSLQGATKGSGSPVVKVSDRGWPCHEFESITSKDPPWKMGRKRSLSSLNNRRRLFLSRPSPGDSISMFEKRFVIDIERKYARTNHSSPFDSPVRFHSQSYV
ncbi:hypothetical protein TNCV_1809601 [Trichonephila clavipes]|nr:hypothetical protein TNCV_1809601 [Trichonephila clavipes]